MNLANILPIIEELRLTNSNKDKQSILERNKDNETLKTILEYTYNPFKRYGITEKTFEKYQPMEILRDLTLIELLDELAAENINDALRRQVVTQVSTYPAAEQEIVKCILTKDLKAGMSASTINKVWKNLVPKFEVQLAKKFSDVKLAPEELIFITEKLDGIRCVIIKEGKNIKFFTRQGKEIIGLNEIKDDMEILFDGDVVLDGELLADNPEKLNSGDLYRKTVKIVNSKSELKTGVKFYAFDIMVPEEFKRGKSIGSYKRRRSILEGFIDGKTKVETIQIVPLLYKGENHNKIFELLEEVEKQGKEGLMINRNCVYECKRTSSLLKVKSMNTCDLEVVGYEEGTGRNKSRLGALIVEYKGNKVAVGSGYSDIERDNLWNSRDELIGKIIEVQYFEESSNENGEVSLRFPIFKELRFDKDIPSLY